MAQFDLFHNPNPESAKWAPFLVDLQHDMLSALATRIMAPLVLVSASSALRMQRLNPVIPIDGEDYFLSTAEMAAVPISALPEATGNLTDYRDDLLAAVDLLFTAV